MSLRGVQAGRVQFSDRTVEVDADSLKRTFRTPRLLEAEIQRRLQAGVDDGFVVQVHVYSIDPLDFAQRVTQREPLQRYDDDDDWWVREEISEIERITGEAIPRRG